MKSAIHSLAAKFGAGAAGLLALMVALIAINALLARVPIRMDMTAEHLFTLSSGTRDILRQLDRSVTLTFVFNASNPQIPGELRTYARRVEDLLRTFSMSSRGRVRFVRLDPLPDSEQEDLVQDRYGIAPRSFWGAENPILLGIVVSSGNRQEKIAFADPGREAMLEYDLARLIVRVTRARKPVVAVLSSLPVLGSRIPFMMPGQPAPAEPWAAFQQLKEDADVREIDSQNPDIPAETELLVVVHPQNLPPATLFSIDQFVLKGGSCIVLVDPLCQAEIAAAQQNQAAMMMGGPKGSSDLAPLLAAWGVSYDSGRLLADQKAGTRLMMNSFQPEYQPFFLTYDAVSFNSQEILSAGLRLFQAPFPGGLRIQPVPNVSATPLISASARSGLMEAAFARMPPASAMRAFKPDPDPLCLAVKLTGTFPSAFPNGKPPPDEAGNTNALPAETEVGTLTNGIAPATVVVVADVDFLHNQFGFYALGADEGLYGKPVQNAAFLLNAVETLAGNGLLARIQARGKTLRPFTRVQELAFRAEQQWQDQDIRIQNEIEKLRGELQKLEVRRGDQIEIVLTREQEAAIQRFNKQIKALEKEQKAVRRKLREGIETLGLIHKAFNLLLAPALVILGGVVYGIVKRRRVSRL